MTTVYMIHHKCDTQAQYSMPAHPDTLGKWTKQCLEAELFRNPNEKECIELRKELRSRA